MFKPFRFPSRSCSGTVVEESVSNDRSFAFRRAKGRRISTSKRPLATCTYDATGEEEEEDENPIDCVPAPLSPPKQKIIRPLFSPERDSDDSSDDGNSHSPSPDWGRKRKLTGNRPGESSRRRQDSAHQHLPRLNEKTANPPRLFSAPSSKPRKTSDDRFQSILDRPFRYWQELNSVFKEVHPGWTSYQRGRMVHHLVHFLELKVGINEYVPTGLLLPSPVVEDAWKALVLETSLYLHVTYAIQDFHQKEREMIHYTFLSNRNLPPKEAEDKLRRTQSLFHVYFKEPMPMQIEDEPRESPPPPTVSTTIKLSMPMFEFSSLSLKNSNTHNNNNNNSSSSNSSSNNKYKGSCKPPRTPSPTLSPGSSSMEDGTAETQSMYSSAESDSERLMGLELVE